MKLVRAHRKAGGFTLMELLIAITLLGFILVLLFGGMRLGARIWDAGELRSENNTHLSLVQSFVRRELSQIHPYRWKKKPTPEYAFVGESGKLNFVAPVVAQLGPGGLHLVRLEVVKDKDSGQLVMIKQVPEADSADFSALDGAEKIVLAEKAESVSFSYFGADSKDAEPQWTDKWDNGKRMPFLIRMRVKFSNGREWPDLVVSPMIGAEVGCEWDPAVNRCVGGI
ncbi:N/A [soil metagenome]